MITSLSISDLYLVIVGPLFFTFVYIYLEWPIIVQNEQHELILHHRNCKFKPVANVSSTEKDAIFTATTIYNKKIEYLIKSFKTTGSRAVLYIFTTNDVSIPEFYLDNQTIQVKVGNQSTRIRKSPYKARWEWYYSFLVENENRFDRIMHTDAFDAVFFGDPFSLIDSKDKLYVQLEGKIIKECPYNKRWVKQCHNFVNKDFYHNTIACSGSLAGGYEPFKYFIEKLITHKEWPLCWGHGSDQGDFNYILWSHYYEFPFQIVEMGCESGFSTMNYCANTKKLFNKKNQLIAKFSHTALVYAHQYNRFNQSKEYIEELCS